MRRPDLEAGAGQSEQAAGRCDNALKSLPAPPPGAAFNAEEQAKSRAFKEARRGAADYKAMEGEFAKYLQDVYSAAPVERDALTDECEILVIGASFAALLLRYKLRAAGFAMSDFAKKAAMSAAPGIGTAIPASPATWNRTAICPYWR